MTDNEIIKALECCTSSCREIKCNSCPAFVGCRCTLKSKMLLDLINRQKAEIERLNGCVKSEEEIRAIMKSQMIPFVKEIVNEQFDIAVKLARAEAIREFAERYKKQIYNLKYKDDNAFVAHEMEFIFKRVATETIDYLVKEMMEGGNG